MHRFLTTPESVKNGIVTFGKDDAKHMIKVLRHKRGDIVLAFDGSGRQYEVELVEAEKDRVCGKIIKSCRPDTEPKTKVILFQGIPKADKMEWIVQKTVELGIWKIVPVITQFSVVSINDRKSSNRTERWNRISKEACKQSGRVVIPEVTPPVPFEEALNYWNKIASEESGDSYPAVFCHEKERKNCLKELFKCYNIKCIKTIGVFIGPEGGFSDKEVQLATDCHIKPVSLGKRILRTETASIAVLSAIMYETGELRA
ncbi:MAG: 16S rRNA (uracil(1498)-N(3))-methyltransferase [Clostridiaceae bacterium]|jgi:16S rRNA (uracil1498-N3)-methyltransferase|nr:16S rRNA (uracil(1498)-N(3))-methyltransferase [Clostridiaceae bacterium]